MSTIAASAPVSCPDCERDDVMPSMPQGRIERFLFSAFLIYRFRCRACLCRFARRKVGRSYVPLLRSADRVIWGVCLSVISVSLVSIALMGVKARLFAKRTSDSTAAPAVAPPVNDTFKADVVEDVPAKRRAHSDFMNNFNAGSESKGKAPQSTGAEPKSK